MKKGMYRKLAWNGMQKNKRLYLPYIIACTGMVMMYYIMAFLADSESLNLLRGTGTLRMVLGMGCNVIGVFAAIFLFYTHAFLIRSRKKEFALYNILGMNKKNISRILLWETLIELGIALGAGVGLGIAFSKLAELGLINMMRQEISYDMFVSLKGICKTVQVFCVIFAVILLNTLRQMHFSNVVTLLNSDKTGEKPPKANWFLGLAGIVMLGIAYGISVGIEDPLSALSWFFTAVLMVVIATYLLFVSGSVLICRILQKNKKYYYKANHFVSVSSMAYRMKRNGAGLASICILGTMVLVMISSSSCLFIGTEDTLRMRYPRDINLDVEFPSAADMNNENMEVLRGEMAQLLKENNQMGEKLLDYRYVTVTGCLTGNEMETDVTKIEGSGENFFEGLCGIYFVPLDDYNELLGTDKTLADGEVLLYAHNMEYAYDSINIHNGGNFHVAENLDSFWKDNGMGMDILPALYVVVNDLEKDLAQLSELIAYDGSQMAGMHWNYSFNMQGDLEEHVNLCGQISDKMQEHLDNGHFGIKDHFVASLEANRDEFYANDGGIFFLGIILSMVFLVATVLIIYYKQTAEGFEDEARFAIMQKVGMTKKDIKKSINSQMLTVFFMPLIVAAMHLAFAFPVIEKLLLLFGLMNHSLFVVTTMVSILVFAVFYVIVYRITSRVYYEIVSK